MNKWLYIYKLLEDDYATTVLYLWIFGMGGVSVYPQQLHCRVSRRRFSKERQCDPLPVLWTANPYRRAALKMEKAIQNRLLDGALAVAVMAMIVVMASLGTVILGG